MKNQFQLGTYQILEEIGRGATSIVYRAIKSGSNRQVALKVLHPNLLNDQVSVQRFIKESHVISQLTHSHIVRLYETGTENGRIYMATSLIQGVNLQTLVQRRSRLSWDDALLIFDTICGAISHAHESGIIHRDIKPTNILLEYDHTPYISDFGIAKVISDDTVSNHTTFQVIGTPEYIAPEIWSGLEHSVYSDIYSLACLFLYTVLGKSPFSGETVLQIMHAHDNGPSFSEDWPSGIPVGFQAVILRGLAKSPYERFSNAKEFANALRSLREPHMIELLDITVDFANDINDFLKTRVPLIIKERMPALIKSVEVATTSILSERVLRTGILSWRDGHIGSLNSLIPYMELSTKTLIEGDETVKAIRFEVEQWVQDLWKTMIESTRTIARHHRIDTSTFYPSVDFAVGKGLVNGEPFTSTNLRTELIQGDLLSTILARLIPLILFTLSIQLGTAFISSIIIPVISLILMFISLSVLTFRGGWAKAKTKEYLMHANLPVFVRKRALSEQKVEELVKDLESSFRIQILVALEERLIIDQAFVEQIGYFMSDAVLTIVQLEKN